MSQEDISELKELEKNSPAETATVQPTPAPNQHHNRSTPSLMGPIILIAIGGYFLLNNMGLVELSLNWEGLFRLWPAILIFVGLNIIVQQIPGGFGRLLSGLLGIVALLFFGSILLFSDNIPFLSQISTNSESREHASIQFPTQGVETAEIYLDLTSVRADIDILNDSDQLLEAEIDYSGNLRQELSVDDGHATVNIRTENSGIWVSGISWSNDDVWDIDLSPRVPTELYIDMGSGSSDVNLERMQLTNLHIDGASGSSTIYLPDGSYEASLDTGSGRSEVTLPQSGTMELLLDSGSGSVTINVPFSMEARVLVDRGSGGFSADNRFTQVDGERNDDGIWETDGYEEGAANSALIIIDGGSGSLSVEN